MLGLLAHNLNCKKLEMLKYLCQLCCLVTELQLLSALSGAGSVMSSCESLSMDSGGVLFRCICTVSVEMDQILLQSPAFLEALCWTHVFAPKLVLHFVCSSQSVIDFILLCSDFHKNQFTLPLLFEIF